MRRTPPLSVTQAAEQIGIPARTLRYSILQGDLKAHKLGGATSSYLIDQRDLDKFVAKRAAKVEASA
jgi:excisionase family DNA binding protein